MNNKLILMMQMSLAVAGVLAQLGCVSSQTSGAGEKTSPTGAGALHAESKTQPALDPMQFDVVVVGGGVAGMTSALYLTAGGKKVLLLETGMKLGALASWAEGREHIRGPRGVRDQSDSYQEVIEILKQLDLEPARHELKREKQSYVLNGKFQEDFWNAKSLAKLPPAFRSFHGELLKAVQGKKVPAPPFEDFPKYGGSMELDALTAEAWLKQMPGGEGAAELLAMVDLYCRANFGGGASEVSAMAFASLFSAEVESQGRVSGDLVALKLASLLENRSVVFWYKTSAVVSSIKQDDKGVAVVYKNGEELRQVRSKFVVYADSLELAPGLIEDWKNAKQIELFKAQQELPIIEHRVQVAGVPFQEASTVGLHDANDVSQPFAQFRVVNWQQVASRAKGLASETFALHQVRGTNHAAPNDDGLKDSAALATQTLEKTFAALPKGILKGKFSPEKISSHWYARGTRLLRPGFFSEQAPVLRSAVDRVYFAGSGLGMPTLEEALFRGHCAASNILSRFNRAYKLEAWSRCPLELGAGAKSPASVRRNR